MKTNELKLSDCKEYDQLAEHCAKKGLSGDFGTELPANVSQSVMEAINGDIESFVSRVKSFKYEIAMKSINY